MSVELKKILFTFVPTALVFLIFAAKNQVMELSERLPPCVFHGVTGLWCPGCGNTRAVREMMSFHFIRAVRFNALPPLLCAACAVLYIRYLISSWIRPLRPIPVNYNLIAAVSVLFAVYCIVRNIFEFMPSA